MYDYCVREPNVFNEISGTKKYSIYSCITRRDDAGSYFVCFLLKYFDAMPGLHKYYVVCVGIHFWAMMDGGIEFNPPLSPAQLPTLFLCE